VEEVIKLFKGGSSYWINDNRLVRGRFAWGRGYGAFSVSHSDVGRVARYIARQEEHHRKKSYLEEYELFVDIMVLSGVMKETVKTVFPIILFCLGSPG
jgi:hypothetical protein